MRNLLLSICFICFVILNSSCTSKKRENNSLLTIDIEANINEMQVVNLSQFTTDIKYIPLQTRDDIIFTGIWKCVFSDSLILANNLSQCILYNAKGEFLNKIGIQGRGPGEFQYCLQAEITKDKIIYLQNRNDLMEYKLDGSFIKINKNTFSISGEEDLTISGWSIINDSLFFGHIPNNTGQSKYRALITNKEGVKKIAFKNYDILLKDKPSYGFIEDLNDQYIFKGNLFYREFSSDTIFRLNNESELNAQYAIHLGKYKMPVSIRANPSAFGKENLNYITIWNFFETDVYLLLSCGFGNRFPAKRLTPITSFPGTEPSWYNTRLVLGLFNKRTGDFKFCKPTDTDNRLYTTGIYNDIDGGPRFFPDEMVNDSTLVMLIDAKKFKDHIESDDFKNSTPKFPEKKEYLKTLSESISIYDNSILMVVTFKKNKE